MANNRAIEAGKIHAVGQLQLGLSSLERVMIQQIPLGLAEGKTTLKEKEMHKIAYFQCLWHRSNLKDVKITDRQSIVNHFTSIMNSFDASLDAYCREHRLLKERIFSAQKIELFKSVIQLREVIALQRYCLSQFLPAESLASFEKYAIDLSSRSIHIEKRMAALSDKLNDLPSLNEACMNFNSVLVQHIKDRELGFAGVDEPRYPHPTYEGELLTLSTLLNGMPYKNTLDADIKVINGDIKVYKSDVEASRQKIPGFLECFEALILAFEEQAQLIAAQRKRHDAALNDWLRRREELKRLLPNLDTTLGDALDRKYQALGYDYLDEHVRAVINACAEMPNRVWRGVTEKMKQTDSELQAGYADFSQKYGVCLGVFRAAKQRIQAFNDWHQDEFLPEVNDYEANVVKLHAYVQEALMVFHHYYALLKKINLNPAGKMGFFFRHHGSKVALGGVVGAAIALPMCVYLFTLDLPHSLAYAGASFLTGAVGGLGVGGVKECCEPSFDETEPLLIEEPPKKPSERDPLTPSYRVPAYVLNLFPSIRYEEDIELGEARRLPSYGSIN